VFCELKVRVGVKNEYKACHWYCMFVKWRITQWVTVSSCPCMMHTLQNKFLINIYLYIRGKRNNMSNMSLLYNVRKIKFTWLFLHLYINKPIYCILRLIYNETKTIIELKDQKKYWINILRILMLGLVHIFTSSSPRVLSPFRGGDWVPHWPE